MRARTPIVFTAVLLLCGLLSGQAPPGPSVADAPKAVAPEGKGGKDAAPAPGGNAVEGLTLPADFEVAADEQFVEIQAKCKGPVTFLVLSTASRIKYKLPAKGESTITVGVPPVACEVSVFCVGYSDEAKAFTPWARCNITVKGPAAPLPGPDTPPGPGPVTPAVKVLPAGTRLHITVVEDPLTRTEATRSVLEDAKGRQALVAAGHTVRVRDVNDAATKRLGFSALYAKVGGPTLVVQVADGKAGAHPPVGGTPAKLPPTPEAFLSYIDKLFGGK